MSSETTREKLMEATMQLASEVGLFGFSMKQVTDRVGVSESLLFKYYETKENLLLQCFLAVNRRRMQAFSGLEAENIRTREDAEVLTHNIWRDYYEFLIQNGFRTVFYYEYRDSAYMMEYMRRHESSRRQPAPAKQDIVRTLAQYFEIRPGAALEILRVWFVDVTGGYAKRVIRGEVEHTEETAELIWTLLWKGFLELTA